MINLTEKECLMISRRRSGWSQADVAKLYQVSVYEYLKWERTGDKEPPSDWRSIFREHGVDTYAHLSDSEYCWISRKRSGKTIMQVAQETGIPAPQIHAVERWFDLVKVLNYWKAKEL